mgnify:CR=1 FL=1
MPNRKETLQSISMSGGGNYSLATRGAEDVINSATSIVLETIDSMNISKDQDFFTFSDIGTADGGTSLKLIGTLINSIQKINSEISFNIIYTDQPKNDFNGLVKTVLGLGHFPSYLDKTERVFQLFSANSFYNQILPNNSLDFGFSATAMHWLSEKPCDISNHVHMVGANHSERLKFEKQALKDWESILLSRSKELVKGGRFICLNFGIDESGRYLGNTGGYSMFDKFAYHWKSLLNNAIITEDEYKSATFSQHYRTISEFRKPFDNQNSDVYKSGLRLKSIRTRLTKCPYKENYKKNIKKMTKNDFAENLIPTMRSWSETVFRTALLNRKEEEINQIVNKFYNSYQKEIVKNPEGHSMDYIHIIMDIEKI